MTGSTTRRSSDRIKVAILGGGCGGLAAAWKLSSTDALRERFEVSVYQLGWQLGGKGASGRMPHGNGTAEVGQRIEEHGLHIWFGFYDHAFRMLRQAYEETELAAGDDWWRVPFEKCNSVSLYERRDDDTWIRQAVDLPARGGPDRGPPTAPSHAPLTRVIARTTRLLATGLRSELGQADTRRGGSRVDGADPLSSAVAVLDQIAGEMNQLETPLTLAEDDAARRATRGREPFTRRPLQVARRVTLDPMLDHLWRIVRELQGQYAEREMSHRARLWCGVLELLTASLAGIVADDVVWRGLATLDEEDLREWLGRHGARAETLARSPVLRGLYDLSFAYRDGDKRRPSLAAGRGLQALLMMINYEGAFMWRMRAGMGDVVFAPLYLGLKQRGVRFNFFSRVSCLRLMPGKPVVDSIEFVTEANVIAGAEAFDPLKRVGEWWCWPSSADRSQLGEAGPTAGTLTRGVDFDEVVLAIPVGALDGICSELAAANRRFRQMLDGAHTVATKALQVWLTMPLDELRGDAGKGELDPPATAYAEPFDTYCDMSHLLDAEGYGAEDGPRGVAYFCSVLPDEVDASQPESAVRAAAQEYLEQHAQVIWPRAFSDGRFDWNVLFDPAGSAGSDRLDAQYLRANVAPADRYVTTPAGSVDSRLDPGESGFENLVLAGDWTRSGIDGGCVEAAVVSGERAAEALVARRSDPRPAVHRAARYVDYGALATAPGPLLCERARLYCFFVKTDHARVQHLCDRVLKHPTGGELRYQVPRLTPIVLSFGTIAGLRSLHHDHAGRGSASEPEAAIWVPTIGQRLHDGRYVDDHLAIFMPYIWVDDPIAFASGREVYGFAKTQGWMRHLGDPRTHAREPSRPAPPPNPPEELALDVYGAAEYGAGAELGRERLITVRRSAGARRGARAGSTPEQAAEGEDLSGLVGHLLSALDPDAEPDLGMTRRSASRSRPFASVRSRAAVFSELLTDQITRLVFLKQIRDATHGEFAALQQVVEARSSVTPGSLRWRRLPGTYELSVRSLASHPLEAELGLGPRQTIRLAFAAEFGFRMEPGVVRWP
jgi:uncharacterized protein with NAD-binding domain and iron-sulfur cluster